MRERHNAILERLRKALKTIQGTLLVDQKISSSPGQLRPDLTLIQDNKITIVDVTIPFESGSDAFMKARTEKQAKYSDLIQWAKSKYELVEFGAVVIGSLGSWDTQNDDIIQRLGVGRGYAPPPLLRNCAASILLKAH